MNHALRFTLGALLGVVSLAPSAALADGDDHGWGGRRHGRGHHERQAEPCDGQSRGGYERGGDYGRDGDYGGHRGGHRGRGRRWERRHRYQPPPVVYEVPPEPVYYAPAPQYRPPPRVIVAPPPQVYVEPEPVYYAPAPTSGVSLAVDRNGFALDIQVPGFHFGVAH